MCVCVHVLIGHDTIAELVRDAPNLFILTLGRHAPPACQSSCGGLFQDSVLASRYPPPASAHWPLPRINIPARLPIRVQVPPDGALLLGHSCINTPDVTAKPRSYLQAQRWQSTYLPYLPTVPTYPPTYLPYTWVKAASG